MGVRISDGSSDGTSDYIGIVGIGCPISTIAPLCAKKDLGLHRIDSRSVDHAYRGGDGFRGLGFLLFIIQISSCNYLSHTVAYVILKDEAAYALNPGSSSTTTALW